MTEQGFRDIWTHGHKGGFLANFLVYGLMCRGSFCGAFRVENSAEGKADLDSRGKVVKAFFSIDGVEWKIYDVDGMMWGHSPELNVRIEADTREELIREAARLQHLLARDLVSTKQAPAYTPKKYALMGETFEPIGKDAD